MTGDDIARALRQRIAETLAEHRSPLVVFDLDGTLYNNGPRTLRIIREFAHLHARTYPGLLTAVDELPLSKVRYRIADTMGGVGIADPELLGELERFWFQRFFTNDYVVHDLPVAGAVELVASVYEAGGVPVYLTGRDAPNMLIGTLRALQRDGFPVGMADTRCILKDTFDKPDAEYKRAVVDHLRQVGRVVGAFDNEPGLCNVFKEAFPEAVVVWLDTSHAPGAPALLDGIHAARDFTGLLG